MAKQTPAETPAELIPVEVPTPAVVVETNFIVEDNTEAAAEEEKPVVEEEVELMNGFTQVNYV